MTDYKLVPVKQIRDVIYVLEKLANDTFRGRNAARELRELLSPPADGEEIMVSVGYDVYTLPLHPTGLTSGPRFVVHVPDPERPAAEGVQAWEVHPDDAAVDAFAAAMKEKLATARAKGRGGWNGDEPGMQQRLSDMLRAHVEKGDPRDVANFCMFLHQRGESILSQQPAPPSAPVGVEGPLSLLRAGHWREVYIGHRCMRLEVTYDYATWERLMAEVESALAQQSAVVDEAMVERCTDVAIASITQRYRGESFRDSWRRLVRDVLTAALSKESK